MDILDLLLLDQAKPEIGWENPPHRSHQCQSCNWIWRPSDSYTNGVAAIQTQGQNDQSPIPRDSDISD